MALEQPWGKFSIKGRSASARAADIRRLDELVDLMPKDALRSAVRHFLASASTNKSDDRALRRILKQYPRRAVTGSADMGAIGRQVSVGVIPPSLIEEEAHIAAQELVRHWIDSLRLALEGWSDKGWSE